MNLKNLFSLIIISFLFSCSNPNYEYVLKDDAFRKTIKTGNFTELTNGFTYYEIENRFNENTLVFIHGFSVPSYIWDKTYNTAKEKGFKVVKLDLYGRGFSDNPDIDYTDELFANQVIELLQELEIKKATFLGLSNGGRVISKLADLKPNMIEKLVYVSASSFNSHENNVNKSVSKEEVNAFIKNRYPTISSGQLSDFKYPENYPLWDDKYEELLKFKGFARALISTVKNHKNLDLENKEISDSNKKVYTIWGDSDSVVIFNNIKGKLNKLLPNRFEYTVPNSGHLPHIENQSDFEKYLFEVVLK
ncbi:MAG: alpha/beta fold hydrolase [Flavobacteriaceae bacterium]|mgnify:FL=1|jgi:pimeloyl-ACP methyl ester carboxylesterase|nr:alpha/beta fold hydrolase [Flavobacteriaceae bacterium]MBT5232978.1 alpha/beta fold hydrolase [Flavobacteriaceae bacterium]MBT7573541.1 alpha/beta fold hydrolase [Flavobacteriaceae bacterium]